MKIVVLKGGPSAEREVSLSSGAAVEKALHELGHEVVAIDPAEDVVERLREANPDVVFNALHGRYGEDGTIQGILEWLHIPYTHSGVLASALAMNKPAAKHLFVQANLHCAQSLVCSKEEALRDDLLPRPYVMKPMNEGSSVGVVILQEGDAFPYTKDNWPFGDSIMIESYIPGREIQVAVLDDKALGAIEIVPQGKFYDYEAKYTDGKAQHVMPAPIDEGKYQEVLQMALIAHQALGCRGLTRSDFRYNEQGDGQFYILETNTQPGMTPLSLAPEIAAHMGITFNALVDQLIKGACCDG